MEGRCRVDRCALFVDAGYVLADGAMAVHGTRHRESVAWDYAGLLQLLCNLAREGTGLPLLRCYWYEAAVEGRRTPDHDALADLPGLKLRLGRLRPGRREGVDAEMHRDLSTLAHNRAISDAVIVSVEEDLAQVVGDVQDLGVRVTLVHITADGNWAISRLLRQECDALIEVGATHLWPHVNLIAGAQPAPYNDQYPPGQFAGKPLANGHGSATHHRSYHALPAGHHQGPPAIYTSPAAAPEQEHATEPQDAPGAAADGGSALPPAEAPPQPASAATGPAPEQAPVGQPADPSPSPAGAPAAGGHAQTGQAAADPAAAGQTPVGDAAGQVQPQLYAAPTPAPPTPVNGAPPLPAPTLAGAFLPTRAAAAKPASTLPAGPPEPAVPAGPPEPALPARQPAPGTGWEHDDIHGQPGRTPFVPASPELPSRRAPLAQSAPPSHPGPAAITAAHAAGPIQPGTAHSTADQPGTAQAAAGQPGTAYAAGAIQPGTGPAGPIQPGTAHAGPIHPGTAQAGPTQPGPTQPGTGPAGPTQPGTAHAGPTQPGTAHSGAGQPSFLPAPYVPTLPGPYGGPQPGPPVAATLADAVQAAHAEGLDFGESVARDAPALWLEAVLARKPRMPSDLEARLLQGSSLPIDFLLHDEVRSALRRGFWDALERSRR
jgi:uncharacterized LabA/DUF88 family protein